MPETPTEYKYYPALSDIMKADDLPDFLSFIKEGLQNIFDKIYYKDYQVSKSISGSSAFYSLDIVSRRKLALELPGTDVYFVLNPDYDDHTISSFPITVFWQWEVMRYIRYFNVSDFSFSLEDFYNLALEILNISEEQAFLLTINTFVVSSNPNISKFDQLVEDINLLYGTSIAIDSGAPNRIQELIIQVELINKKVFPTVFALYLLDSDLETTKNKINTFFSSFIPNDLEEYIKNIITPKARVTLELSAAVEFPRKILVPWLNGAPHPNPNEIARFQFAQAILYADTEAGIGYQLELAGTLNPTYCEIGNTGMLIQIESLKLDLSKKTNIPEADADGRPDDFTGVYARALSVTLPARWFHNDAVQGTPATTLRLGGYDLLIGTGGVSGTFMLETVPSTIAGGTTYYFEDKFDLLFPVTVFEKNTATNAIEEVSVANLDVLKEKLFPTDANVVPSTLKFPITLTERAPLTGGTKVFETIIEYQSYLNTLSVDNSVDTVPTLWKKIGSEDKGFRVGFNKFDISIKQNKVVSSNIKGALEIKKFVYPAGAVDSNNTSIAGQTVHLDIEGHLQDDGDFNLTATAEQAYPIEFPNVFKYYVKSAELGKEDDDFYVGTSGTLQFEGFLKNTLNLGAIEIERLRIYTDGSIEFKGGSVQLIEPIVLPLGPVNITVSAIHYGSHQKEVNGKMRKFNYFGFDGGISIDPLGIEVRGDGVKYYYCVDDVEGHEKPKPYLHIQTLYLDLTIPADSGSLAQINGWVTIPEPGVSKEYAGGITLQIPKAKLAGKAEMKLMPKYPAFIIDCELEPPVPIPLGTFAIYGFRGLLGYRYVAEKEAIQMTSENTWYEYYKAPKRGINVNKFSGPDRSVNYDTLVSLGAGATLGTSADDGYTFSIKAMALFSIPSLFMIDGRANIISARLGLDDTKDPPFFAFVAVGDDSLEFGFGADYKLPGNGNILSVYADVQAGFFFKNQRPWYVNIGTNTNPVTARIITLLTIQSYVMLSAKGIEAGARGEFNFDRNYSVIKVKAHAFIEIGGKISFERPQMGSYLMAGVNAQIKVLFVSLGLEVGILFGVEAPKPFLIYGKFYFKIKVGIKIFGKRITLFKFSGDLEVVWNFNKTIDREPINPLIVGIDNNSPLTQAERAVLNELVQGVNMLTNESFSLGYLDSIPTTAPGVEILNHIIPLDTYIDIKTQKGLLPGNSQDPNNSVRKLVGGINNAPKEYEDLIPPVSSIRGRSIRQVKHQYTIDHLVIKFWNKSQSRWDDYHPYEALYPTDPSVRNLKVGHFQKVDGKYNALRILGTTPFSYTEQGQPGWFVPEQYGLNSSTLFCEAEFRRQKCTNIPLKPLNARYYCGNANTPFFSNNVSFQLITSNQDDYAFISNEPNIFNQPKSLAFNNWNDIEILLPEPSRMTALKLSNYTNGVKVKFYSIIQSPANDVLFNVTYGNPNPNASAINDPYEMVLSSQDLQDEVRYNFTISPNGKWNAINPNWRPVTKIVIEPLFDNTISQQIALLEEEIATIENNNDMISLGLHEGEILSTDALEEELHQLACNTGNSGSFINRYRKNDRLNYYFSKEFTERNTNFIYSLGTTEKRGLISKVAADGSLVWERKYSFADEKETLIFKRIIRLERKEDYQYVVYATTGRKQYLLSISPEDGKVLWVKHIEWKDEDVFVHIAPSKKDFNFYLVISDRNYIDTYNDPFVAILDSNGEYLKGINLVIDAEELIINCICEDQDGLVVVGRYLERPSEDSVGTIIKVNNNLEITATSKIDKRHTTVHDIKIVDDKKYLISGYDNKEDGIFVSLIDSEETIFSYQFPDSKHLDSDLQLSDGAFYLLLNNGTRGILHLMTLDFELKWKKEIDLESGTNGIRIFTFNPHSKKISLNSFNQLEGSLLVHTNENFESCLTRNLKIPTLVRQKMSMVKLEVKIEEFVIKLRALTATSEQFTSEIKKYCTEDSCGEEDVAVCNLHSQILEINDSCLIDPSIISENSFETVAACYNQILNLIKSFDSSYDLNVNLSSQILLINQFLGKRDLQKYTLAWHAVHSMLNYLDKIGNCLCECNTKDFTLIHQVCWMSVTDYDYNINIPSQAAIEADSQATINGVTQYIQPIWRPDTSYFIHFVLKDSVDNGTHIEPYDFTYGFTTAGPVGYFHTHDEATYGDVKLKQGDRLLKEDNSYYVVALNGLLNEGGSLAVANSNGFILEDTRGFLRDAATKALIIEPGSNPPRNLKVVAHPDKYPLTTLKQYIDYNRSYPNADGNLLSAKPLFYNDKTTQIYLFFNKAYATHFFHKWNNYKNADGVNNAIDGRLKIVIKDPTEGVEIVNPPSLDVIESITTIPQTEQTWQIDDDPQVPFIVSQYLNLYKDSKCTGTITTIKPKSEYVKVTPRFLKPNKLYTAIVNNMYDFDHDGVLENTLDETREVHKFVFKTSRYATFKEQVESYYLKQTIEGNVVQGEAFFNIEMRFTQEAITAAYNTIVGQSITGFSSEVTSNLENNYQHPYDRIVEGILELPALDEAISTEVNVIRNLEDSKVIALVVRNPEPFNNPRMPLEYVQDVLQIMSGITADASYKILFSKDYSQAIIMHSSKEITTNSLVIQFKYKIWNGSSYVVPDEDTDPLTPNLYTVKLEVVI